MRKTNIENAKDDNRDDIDVIVQALPFFTASQQYHLVTRFIIIIIISSWVDRQLVRMGYRLLVRGCKFL